MINSTRIDILQRKINEALKEIEKEEKVKITFGTISYNNAYYTTQMKLITTEKTEKVRNVYEGICKRLGFTQDIIGMRFESKGYAYEITEIKTRNRKYPVIAERIGTGQSFKFAVNYVKSLIGGDKIINRNANLDKLVD
jgi:hypothetical protein